MTFVHPIYGLLAYFLTYYQHPNFRWWGASLPSLRWSMIISLAWMAACFVSHRSLPALRVKTHPQTIWLVLLVINAFFVSVTTAVWQERSWEMSIDLLKFGILYFMIIFTIRTKEHFNYALYIHVFGIFTWGWDAFRNPRRKGGRLYGVGGPTSQNDNGTSSVLVAILPLAASVFFTGTKWVKLASSGAAVFALNAFILCNSRGGLLGLVIEGLMALKLSKGLMRRHIILGTLAGAIVFFSLLDPQYIERQFVGSQEYGQDGSASGRLDMWKAAIDLSQDYPLGAGGGGFLHLSPIYIPDIVESTGHRKSVHSTYFQVLSNFGIQGLIFLMGFILSTLYELHDIRRKAPDTAEGRKIWFHSVCLTLGFLGLLVAGAFTSRLVAEVLYWLPAFSAALKNLQVIESEQTEEVAGLARMS